jgi:putative acetyltransferase
MIVRREQPRDVAAVRTVVARAFARTDPVGELPVEVELLDQLRDDEGWIPALSLVATDPPDEVVGHVVCTRAEIEDQPVLGLGPLAVRPDRQRQGVGKALMHAVLGAAEALDEPLVALLGDPAYYRRFGFLASEQYGIAPPEPSWGHHFQVRLLSADQPPAGVFTYAQPFRTL